MRTPVERAQDEIVVKHSRFIAIAEPVATQKEARDKLVHIKKQYSDATHVVHAFRVGPSGEVQGMSDDGEPQGTAGRPVLDVIRGENLTFVLVTVVRYFGGTLLGTGGLVRSYGESARRVLSLCKTQEYTPTTPFSFTADYATYQSVKLLLKEYGVSNINEDFGEQVAASGIIATSLKENFVQQLKDVSRGRIVCT